MSLILKSQDMQKKALLVFWGFTLVMLLILGGLIYLLTMPPQKSSLKSSIIQPQQEQSLEWTQNLISTGKSNDSQQFSGTISILIPSYFKAQSLHKFFSKYNTGHSHIKITYLTSSIWQIDNWLQSNWDVILIPSPVAQSIKDNLIKAQSNPQINSLFFYPAQERIEEQWMLIIPFAIDIPVLYVSPALNQIYPLSNINIKSLKEILLIGKKIDKGGNPTNYPILIWIDKLTYHLLKRGKFNLFFGYDTWLYLFTKQVQDPQKISFIFESSYTNWSYYNLQKELKICQRVYKINDLRSCLLKRGKTYIVPGFVYEQKLFKDYEVQIFPLASTEDYPTLIRGWAINKNVSKNKLKKIQSIFQDYLQQWSNKYWRWPNSLSAFQKALIYQQTYSKYQHLELIWDLLIPISFKYPWDVQQRLQNLEF